MMRRRDEIIEELNRRIRDAELRLERLGEPVDQVAATSLRLENGAVGALKDLRRWILDE